MLATLEAQATEPRIIHAEAKGGRVYVRVHAPRSGRITPYELLLTPSAHDVWDGHMIDAMGNTLSAVDVLADLNTEELLIGSVRLKMPLSSLREIADEVLSGNSVKVSVHDRSVDDVAVGFERGLELAGSSRTRFFGAVRDGKIRRVRPGAKGTPALYSKIDCERHGEMMRSLKITKSTKSTVFGRHLRKGPKDGLSLDEAAELMGLTKGSVSTLASPSGGRRITRTANGFYDEASCREYCETAQRPSAYRNATKALPETVSEPSTVNRGATIDDITELLKTPLSVPVESKSDMTQIRIELARLEGMAMMLPDTHENANLIVQIVKVVAGVEEL